MNLRAIVVTKSALFGEALAELLTRAGIAAAHVEEDHIDSAIAAHGPAVALLDAGSLGNRLASHVAALRARTPDVRIIGLARPEDVEGASSALAVWVGGEPVSWLTTDSSVAQMLAAVSGEPAPARRRAARAPAALDHDAALLALLTERERQVLGHLASGLHNRNIALAMGISPNTVRTHVQNIFGKLGIGSRLEAATLAMRLGLSSKRAP